MQSYIFEVRYTLEMSIFEEFYALLANLTHVRNSILFLILYFKHLLKFALPSASLINNFQTYFNLTMSKDAFKDLWLLLYGVIRAYCHELYCLLG